MYINIIYIYSLQIAVNMVALCLLYAVGFGGNYELVVDIRVGAVFILGGFYFIGRFYFQAVFISGGIYFGRFLFLVLSK